MRRSGDVPLRLVDGLSGRESTFDADAAANWTMAGICAHESALKEGERIDIPLAK